jgi:hypothetical protein
MKSPRSFSKHLEMQGLRAALNASKLDKALSDVQEREMIS